MDVAAPAGGEGGKPSGLFSAFSKLGEKTRKLQNALSVIGGADENFTAPP